MFVSEVNTTSPYIFNAIGRHEVAATVDSKQKPPSISAVWCPWCNVGLRWAYGETEVRKITGAWPPIFSACWFRSTAPGFRNWHLPVHMGLLAHPRPCHRLAVPAAPHGPCTRELVNYLAGFAQAHGSYMQNRHQISRHLRGAVVLQVSAFLAGAGTSPRKSIFAQIPLSTIAPREARSGVVGCVV